MDINADQRLDSLLFFSCFFFFCPSGALTQAIRNFAKSLESWLTGAMMDIPEEMVRVKVQLLLLASCILVTFHPGCPGWAEYHSTLDAPL